MTDIGRDHWSLQSQHSLVECGRKQSLLTAERQQQTAIRDKHVSTRRSREVERASAAFGQVITACNNCVPAPPLKIPTLSYGVRPEACATDGRKAAANQRRARSTRRSREDGQRASASAPVIKSNQLRAPPPAPRPRPTHPGNFAGRPPLTHALPPITHALSPITPASPPITTHYHALPRITTHYHALPRITTHYHPLPKRQALPN
jgi:hypothetical protein